MGCMNIQVKIGDMKMEDPMFERELGNNLRSLGQNNEPKDNFRCKFTSTTQNSKPYIFVSIPILTRVA